MKKLFIYYSLSGNGDEVAKYLSNKYDIRKVETAKKMPKNYFLCLLVGGYKAMKNIREKLLNFDNNISNYNEIVVGSPIWNDRLSSPITTILDYLNLEDKKITFVLYSGSGKGEKARRIIKARYDTEPIILKEPKKNKEELNKLEELL